MPWKTMDVQDRRVEFVVSALRRIKPFRALCAEFGISRPTGYLWLERYREGGVAAIAALPISAQSGAIPLTVEIIYAHG
jgi:transposase